MYKLQYYDGKQWNTLDGEWSNWELGWSSLGNDNLNYRIVDSEGKVMKEHLKIQKFKSWVGLSSQVVSTAYNDETKGLTVEFGNGGRYRYSEVPLEIWQKLLITTSIGRFINTDIKPKFEVKKLN